MIRTGAIIVHWGSIVPTVEACHMLSNSGHFTEIAVIANDGSPRPPGLSPEVVRWIIPPRNLGFAGGAQFAFDRMTCDKVAILNADVYLSADTILKCLTALDLPKVGIVGPQLMFPNGGAQSLCGRLTRFLGVPKADGQPRAILSDCSWVTGAALFCRAEVLNTVRLDGSFFMMVEDSDLGVRTRNAGWRVVLHSGVTGTHKGGSTWRANMGAYYSARNRIWFSRRHNKVWQSYLFTLTLVGTVLKVALGDRVRRREPKAKLLCIGIMHGWRAQPTDGHPLPTEPIPGRWIEWK